MGVHRVEEPHEVRNRGGEGQDLASDANVINLLKIPAGRIVKPGPIHRKAFIRFPTDQFGLPVGEPFTVPLDKVGKGHGPGIDQQLPPFGIGSLHSFVWHSPPVVNTGDRTFDRWSQHSHCTERWSKGLQVLESGEVEMQFRDQPDACQQREKCLPFIRSTPQGCKKLVPDPILLRVIVFEESAKSRAPGLRNVKKEQSVRTGRLASCGAALPLQGSGFQWVPRHDPGAAGVVEA